MILGLITKSESWLIPTPTPITIGVGVGKNFPFWCCEKPTPQKCREAPFGVGCICIEVHHNAHFVGTATTPAPRRFIPLFTALLYV
jgi:hypothetical protein